MRLHQTKGARSMQSRAQEQIDSRPAPSPMAIIGAILAQSAIRFLDRQKKEQRVAQKIKPLIISTKTLGISHTTRIDQIAP
jgi:hypothetical protein